jgi:hypothetical protein
MRELEELSSISLGEHWRLRLNMQFWADISSDKDIVRAYKLFRVELSIRFGKETEDLSRNTFKKTKSSKSNNTCH